MPLIPYLPRNTEVARPNKAVLDTERRPESVDTRTVQRGLAVLGEAVQLEPVDGRPFVQAAGAWEGIGEAITRTGSVLGAMELKRRQAEDDVELSRIHGEWEGEEGRIAAHQEANRGQPGTWKGHAEGVVAGFRKRVLGDKKLSPHVKQVAETFLAGRQGKLLGSLDRAATVRTNALAAEGLAAEGLAGVAQGWFGKGDYEKGVGVLRQAEREGYFYAAHREALERQGWGIVKGVKTRELEAANEADLAAPQANLAAVVGRIHGSAYLDEEEKKAFIVRATGRHDRRVQTTLLETRLREDPSEALRTLGDPEQYHLFSSTEREQAKGVALQAREAAGMREMRQAQEALQMLPAERLSTATVADLGVKFKQAQPFQMEVLGRVLAIRQGRAQMNDGAEYESLVAHIDQYDPGHEQAVLHEGRLRSLMEAQFSGKDLERLQSRLEARGKGKEGPVEMGAVTGRLEAWRRSGVFGKMMSAGDRGAPNKPPSTEDKVWNSQVIRRQRMVRETVEREARLGHFKNEQEAIWRMAQLSLPGRSLPQSGRPLFPSYLNV